MPISGCWDAIGDAIDALHDQSGASLTRDQMKLFLNGSYLLEEMVEFGEVDTVIRENLASELSKQLIGERWPTNGDTQSGMVDMDEFIERFNRAAEAAGYAIDF